MAVKTAPTQTKAAFVRSVDPRLSARDVVAKAKAAGITLTDTYVYNVRGAAKAAANAKATPNKVTAKPATPIKTSGALPAVKNGASTYSVESLLKALAAEIGLGRASEILAGERARVQAVLGV
ncbi:MAG: hypothetical protein ABSF69_13880 [Polyangiaceae bacterium]|jgi:hypothetical protein